MSITNQANQLLLQDAREFLIQHVTSLRKESVEKDRLLEMSVCFWLEIESLTGETVSLEELCETVAKACQEQHDYRPIAALGMVLSSLKARQKAPSPAVHGIFNDRVRWQIGCPAKMGESLQPFCYDSLALFGIASGVLCLDNEVVEEVAEWFDGFVGASYERRNIEDWERALLAAVGQILPIKAQLVMPSSANCAQTRLVLSRRTKLNNLCEESDALSLLYALKTDVTKPMSFATAAFSLSAYEGLTQLSPTIAPNIWTIEDTAALLGRFAKGLERWTWESKPLTSKRDAQARKWHVDHEYHVQNLLWSVLAPIFPDLEDEFYTEPIGQKHPRADLGIRSLRLIVEAKFMRATDPAQKIIEEIAADASFYRAQGSPWLHIIPFIWDDGRRSESHDTIRQGLAKLDGIVDTVIISRPGKMVEDTSMAPAPTTPPVPSAPDPTSS